MNDRQARLALFWTIALAIALMILFSFVIPAKPASAHDELYDWVYPVEPVYSPGYYYMPRLLPCLDDVFGARYRYYGPRVFPYYRYPPYLPYLPYQPYYRPGY